MDAGDDKDLKWAEGLEPLTGKEFVVPESPKEEQRAQFRNELDKYLYAKELGIIGVGRYSSERSTLAIGPCGEVPQPQLASVLEGQSPFRFAQEGFRERMYKEVSNPYAFGSSSLSMTYPQLSSTHVASFTSNASPLRFGLNPYLFAPDGGNPNQVSKCGTTRDRHVLEFLTKATATDNYHHHQTRHMTSNLGDGSSKIALPEPKLESHLLPHEGQQGQDQFNHPLESSTKRAREFKQDTHNLKINIDALHERIPIREKLGIKECPRCNRIFPTGQAYGGHMSHHVMKDKKIKASRIGLRIRDAV